MRTLLSIVIPVYNRRDIVGKTLMTVLNQRYRPLEIVLVDNNSTDGSYEYLQAWQGANDRSDFRVKLVREEKPGASAARNRGLAEVDTRWVMFFDSDDIMAPDHCLRAMKVAEMHPEAAIIGWDTRIFLADGGLVYGRFPSENYQWNNLFHGGFATQRWMALTAYVRHVGAWNEEVMMWNDIELGSRLLSKKIRIAKSEGMPTVSVMATKGSITEASGGFADKMVVALDAISRNLPEKQRRWIPFKYVLGASFYGFDHPDSVRVIEKARSIVAPGDEWLLRLLISYLKYIPRGGAALLSPFIRK